MKVVNSIVNRDLTNRKERDELMRHVESGITGDGLFLILRVMSMVFSLNRNFNKNIRNFDGRYIFNSSDGSFAVSIVLGNSKMSVYKKKIENPDVTITFKNAKALKNLALSPKPDIFQSVINQDISVNGNLNYLYRFASMLNELQLIVKRKI